MDPHVGREHARRPYCLRSSPSVGRAVMRPLRSILCVFALVAPATAAEPIPAPKELVLFDFEDPASIKDWSNLQFPDAKSKEPLAKVEQSAEHATSGKHSLRITFAGGRWPTI